MGKPGLWIGVFFLIAFGAIMYSSFTGMTQFRVEVCVTDNGRQACRIASAETQEKAQSAATTNACAQLVSGMTASMACQGRTPVSVKVLSGN